MPFFSRLLDVLDKRIKVHGSWRQDLKRAAILIGKSLNSNDVSMSFLYNMIALERLLTTRGDKYAEALPERIERYRLDWVLELIAMRIVFGIYKKRSEFVHTEMIHRSKRETFCYR